MCFKKKEQPVRSWADTKMLELRNNLSESSSRLEYKAKNAYIYSLSLACYPDGADKVAATEELAKLQHTVLCEIGVYDDCLCQVKNHLKNHGDEMQDYWQTEFRTSHEVIADSIHRFLAYQGW